MDICYRILDNKMANMTAFLKYKGFYFFGDEQTKYISDIMDEMKDCIKGCIKSKNALDNKKYDCSEDLKKEIRWLCLFITAQIVVLGNTYASFSGYSSDLRDMILYFSSFINDKDVVLYAQCISVVKLNCTDSKLGIKTMGKLNSILGSLTKDTAKIEGNKLEN